MSTYDKTDQFIYYNKNLNPSNVCELVRMGVHEGYRGKHIGKRLFKTLEEYAMMKGMKQIVLSTLDRREVACRFYEGVGFKLANKTKLDLEEILGPGDWEDLHVVHYVKPINKI
jgi:GNAT superfamily N-acetyltransferase